MRRSFDRRLSRGSLREIVEEPTESPAPSRGEEETMEEEDKVYVALDKEVKEGKNNLIWALQNTSKEKKIIVVHVYRLPQKIPIMGAWFPANQLREDQVSAYRKIERRKMEQQLDEYINMCARVKVKKAQKLVIEADDVGKVLVDLIAQHGITKLVMGAASDRNYNRRMKGPTAKAALTVQQHADPSCKVWFVCKGNLICTRDASLDVPSVSKSPPGSFSSASSQPEQLKSISLPLGDSLSLLSSPAREPYTARSKSVNFISQKELTSAGSHQDELGRAFSVSRQPSIVDGWDGIPRHYRESSYSTNDEAFANMNLLPALQKNENEEQSSNLSSIHEYEDGYRSSPHDLEDVEADDEVYDKLQNALIEAENLKREAYEESRRRQKAEKDLNDAARKVRAAESLHAKELKERREIEEKLYKEKMEMEALKKERDDTFEELQKANERKLALELKMADSERMMKDITGKLSEAHYVLSSIRREHEVLRRERDDAVKENEKLQAQKNEGKSTASTSEGFPEFSYSDLLQATQDFAESLKVGEGGYGSVYKGFLRHKTVAIKLLNPQGLQGTQEFHQEMNVLSKVRHPNLVNLIGACPEKYALVYEFLPSGSLEDRLARKDNTPALTWQARTRIAAEICSALVFLHSNKPHCIVHGDLKPGNILLDANLVSKLGDFGICRLLLPSINSTTLYHCTFQPKGTFAYMDPELITSGEITARSDVYSFGVILLRLLTGKPPFGISKVVQEALEQGFLEKIVDPSAGQWPQAQAEKLAALGVQCCQVDRRNRPDASDAFKVLEPLMKAAFFTGQSSSSFRSSFENSGRITPSYFICPIRQEVMKDPCIAADGFTYEAEAIKGWLDRGHDTSPMTNLQLPHRELIPNHALRYAIQGWLQEHY